MNLVYFVLLVGVLIFVHELGHFTWAKLFGVRVLTFSLGFGPTLISRRWGETEYRIGMLPLGGYVRMLGESPRDRVRPEDQPRAFFSQPLWRRTIIVLAGPAMNLAFPLVLFLLVTLGTDAQLTPALVGATRRGMPADGILLPGDRIVAVDGNPVRTFDEVSRIVREHPGDPLIVEIERQPSRSTGPPKRWAEVLLPAPGDRARIPELGVTDRVGLIGIGPARPLPILGVTSPNSLAGHVGLRTFDRLLGVAGTRTDSLEDALLPLDQGSMIPITVLRPERVEDALGGLAELDVYRPHFVSIVIPPGVGDPIQRVGLESSATYVAFVRTGSAEHRMGLLPGDRIITVDGDPVRTWAEVVHALAQPEQTTHRLVWRRRDRLHEGTLHLPRVRSVSPHGEMIDRIALGIEGWVPVTVPAPIEPESPFAYALRAALEETRKMAELTVYSAVRLVQGRITVKSIGGPLSVYEETGRAAREGAGDYLRLMAFISVNLGLLNLLPIPTLDGGHLLFFAAETVLRRPVSRKRREQAGLVGVILLLLLMVIAFKNDIERLWPTEEPPTQSER